MEKVSVIIPTRNRKESLYETLAVLAEQKASIHEVIVVDSSDIPIELAELKNKFGFSTCLVLRARPSVCAQRNEGIRRATGDYVLVLDDDISLDGGYIARCLAFFDEHPAALMVSGVVVEKNESGSWEYTWPKISFLRLAWLFVFQLSIWVDPDKTGKGWLNGFFLGWIQRYYKRRANGISKAGWPVLTDFSHPFFRTQIYYLCATLIRRDWMLANPYTEKLDQHGIGENYGIAIKLRPEQGVFILTGTCAYHHKTPVNRLAASDAHYKRVLALDYFSTVQGSASRGWLVWSLCGNLLDACWHLNWGLVVKNGKLIGVLLANRNPLLK